MTASRRFQLISMSDIVKFNSVEELIIELRGEKVILVNNVAGV